MRQQRGNRDSHALMVQGIHNLSSALSRIQGVPETGSAKIARKIGFALGTELASAIHAKEQREVGSDIPALFRRLNLGSVMLQEWDPVFFLSSESKVERLEAAFRRGLLDGVLRIRWGQPVFVTNAMKLERPKSPGKPAGNARRGVVKKNDA